MPIITLIDILAILLIFFIVTTTFKEQQSLLDIKVPQSSALDGAATESSRITLAVSAEGVLELDGKPLDIDALPNALRSIKVRFPDRQLELKADEEAPLGVLIEIWDAAGAAGLKVADLPLRILMKP